MRDLVLPSDSMESVGLRLAVLIPCYNEELAIETVVQDFCRALPEAEVYVYDNNSTDGTVFMAQRAGAIVRSVTRQGKGNVIRQMFADVEADVYVLVDGDDTYAASDSVQMVDKLIAGSLDMVVGVRVSSDEDAYRAGHRFGNMLLTRFANSVFGRTFSDMLSGYRVFSRRYVKSFPALSTGFETETEITVHALELRMPVAEIETAYRGRPPGSSSKLNTYRDGIRIALTIIALFKTEKPFAFFSILGGLFFVVALVLIVPILETYLRTGLVPRFPTAFLSMGLMLLAFFSFTSGVVLDTVTKGRHEMKRLFYLSIPMVTSSISSEARRGSDKG